jgi:hypothetical protein
LTPRPSIQNSSSFFLPLRRSSSICSVRGRLSGLAWRTSRPASLLHPLLSLGLVAD